MSRRAAAIALLVLLIAPAAIIRGFQQIRHSQQYEWEMQDPVDDPPDAERKAEFAFARLKYRSAFGRRSSWGIDSNRADRLFELAIQRLTRIDTKTVEEVIDVDNGPMLDYPWLYAVEVGRWHISAEQGKRIRSYLDRGGFLMVDDFHGGYEWSNFMEGLRQIYPDRPVVDIPADDQIFHIVGDLDKKVQVPGAQYTRTGLTYERADGFPANWRGIYDDKGRLVVVICHNMDLGDAWQYADDPRYPERFASTALHVGVNYLTYSMTH
jgi:hypothetical protein